VVGCRQQGNECSTLVTMSKEKVKGGGREGEKRVLVLDVIPLRSRVLGVLEQGLSVINRHLAW
jgi:hypothetical protein